MLFLFGADIPRPWHDVRPQRLQGEAAVVRALPTAGDGSARSWRGVLSAVEWPGAGVPASFPAGEASSLWSDAIPGSPGLSQDQEVGGTLA